MSSDDIDNSDRLTGRPVPETRLLIELWDRPGATRRAAPRRPVLLAYLAALVGGVVGIPAAILQEQQANSPWWLTIVLVAPIVEEVLKPIGVLFVMEKRFHWLGSRAQIMVMVVLGALTFATLENLMYIHLAHPTGGLGYILWRYIVCTGVHVSASIIFGLGLAKLWLRMSREGIKFRIKPLLKYFIAAAAVHGVYNATVLILAKTGVLTFD